MAVVAAHSPGESGEVRPKRPTGGKASSGRAFNGQTHERDFALTNRVTRPPLDCTKGQQRLCLRNRRRSLRTSGSVGGPDGQPSALPGNSEYEELIERMGSGNARDSVLCYR